MLTLRPNCELCNKDLPAGSEEARICSYECTFCAGCVDNVLSNVCPNCGGGFTARPVRPTVERRAGVSLAHQTASTDRVKSKYTVEQITEFAQTVKNIPPSER